MTFVIVGKVELPELFSEWMLSLLFSKETLQKSYQNGTNEEQRDLTIRMRYEDETLSLKEQALLT